MTSHSDFPIPVVLNVVLVGSNDLERLIEQIYGRKVSIPASYEMGNNSFYNVDLDGVDESDLNMGQHRNDMVKWLKSENTCIDLELVMCDLILADVLPAVNYLIEVWW